MAASSQQRMIARNSALPVNSVNSVNSVTSSPTNYLENTNNCVSNPPELDCANRKRPAIDFRDEPENSPKRHNMEDETNGGLHIEVPSSGLRPSSPSGPPSPGSCMTSSAAQLASYLHDPNDDNKYQLKMTIPSYAAGCIIGKAGTTIVETQKNFHAVIKLSKANENYPFTKERVVLIVGSMRALQLSGRFIQEKIREAVELFGPKLTEESPPAEQRANMAKVLIPHSTVGMLIGRQGANQKLIQSETGAKMEFSPKPDFSPVMERCLTLTGAPKQINDSMDRVLEKIKADPQSGSCPNLVYNISGIAGAAPGLAQTALLDPNYAFLSNDILKLAYNPYAAAALTSPASFGYPGAYLGASYPGAGAGLGQAAMDPTGLYGGLGMTGLGGFPMTSQHLLAGSYLPQQSAATMTAAGLGSQTQRATGASLTKQVDANTLASLAATHPALFNAAGFNQNQLFGAAGGLTMAGMPPGTAAAAPPTVNSNQTGHFLADNSSAGVALGGGAHASVGGAAGVYPSSLPHTKQQQQCSDSQQQAMLQALLSQQAVPGATYVTQQPLPSPAAAAAAGGTGGPHAHAVHGLGSALSLSPALTHEETTGQVVDVAENIIGALLGVGGRTLIEIQTLTQTRIQISPKGDPSQEMRRISIMGPPNSVLNARALIEQRIRLTENLRAQQGKITV